MSRKQNFSLVIMAAGKSARMGFPKPLLLFDENITFLDQIIHVFSLAGIGDIVVVTNSDNIYDIKKSIKKNQEGVRVVCNNGVSDERFYSLKTGLENVSLPNCFFHNADHPFVELKTVSTLMNHYSENSVIMPVHHGKKGHPVLLGRDVVNCIVGERDYSVKINEYLTQFNKVTVEVPDLKLNKNINSKQEYLREFSVTLWEASHEKIMRNRHEY